MSDVMQFVRELLEGKPHGIGLRGVVTHAQKLPAASPEDPTVYLYQIEALGFLYSDVACTRDPALQNLQAGDEVISHMPEPETEGYPLFLLLSAVPPPEEKKPVAKAATEVGASDAATVEEAPLPAFDPAKKDAEREPALV